jgi:hypothetical protein
MTLPTPGAAFGENVRVSKVSGDTLTIYRGFDESVKQQAGPFAAVPPGLKVVVDTDDDFGDVGAQAVYEQEGAQPCTGPKPVPPDTFCAKVFVSPSSGTYETVKLGIANLYAGDDLHDGNVGEGIGGAAHEVGHTTGYEHSRTLSASTVDYQDCYDQMSFDSCGLPGFPGEAGPQEGIIGYDAINLQFHGWILSSDIFNRSGKSGQVTLKLHALRDPNALETLSKSTGANLEAQCRERAHLPTFASRPRAETRRGLRPSCREQRSE